jgi:flagellar biogenesis protein FliO
MNAAKPCKSARFFTGIGRAQRPASMINTITNLAATVASGTNAVTGGGLASSGASLASLIRVLGALAVVFAVLLAGVWLFRNWQRLAVRRGSTPDLRVLETRSLPQRQALYLVGVAQQRFLVGASPAGLTLLSALPDAPEPDLESSPSPQPASAHLPFADALVQALARKP